MKENLYKRLPPLECGPDGSLYRMTPTQRKQASSLIRRECRSCENGYCMILDDGDTVRYEFSANSQKPQLRGIL